MLEVLIGRSAHLLCYLAEHVVVEPLLLALLRLALARLHVTVVRDLQHLRLVRRREFLHVVGQVEHRLLITTMHNGVFTLSDTDTDKETGEKMVCIDLCGGVHTVQRQTKCRKYQHRFKLDSVPIYYVSNQIPNIRKIRWSS